MSRSVLALVNDSKRGQLSLIPNLSDADITRIWDAISRVIIANLKSRKATLIKDIGTFNFVTKRVEVAQNKFLIIQRPVFVVAEKLVYIHNIQQHQHVITGEHKVKHLNYTALALDSGFDRDSVELCVKEVAQAFSRSIEQNLNVQFMWTGIGVLYIKHLKVKMKFFRGILSALDRSEKLTNCMEQRPGTADSVMSDISTLSALDRPQTATFCLPKLSTSYKCLDPIQENEITEERPANSPLDNRETVSPHQVLGVDVDEDIVQFHDLATDEPVVAVDSSIRPPSSSHSVASSKHGSYRPVTVPVGGASLLQRPRSSATATPRSRLSPILPKCSSPVCHGKTGHDDLCYLCMQRSSRNVPVRFSEERARKEAEQTALLQQYQQMKDAEAILAEKEKNNEHRQLNRKIAAYNLGVAEGLRDEKVKRSTEFKKSYVLRDRPLTPAPKYGQRDYGVALETQVKIKNARQTRATHDRKFQEKLEQAQLAEDLANQREQFLRNKAEQVVKYQQALSAQVKNKPLPMPKMEPDSNGPIFGRHDATNLKLLEKKQRAQSTLNAQLSMVAEQKQKSASVHANKLREESDMLKRTKEELIADRVGYHKRSMALRKSLEDNWHDHHESKLAKLRDERKALRTPGLLLLQQTEHYKRCNQCQRKTTTCGESNIWRDSRYIPGSRLIV